MTSTPTTPNSNHDSAHEVLLHQVVTGDLERTHERVRELENGCEVCRDYLHDTLEVSSLLDDVLGEQAGSLEAIDMHAPAPGADRIAETLRALAAAESLESPTSVAPSPLRSVDSPRAPARPRHGVATAWRVSLAAAAVMVAGWLVRILLPPPEAGPLEGDTTLGSGRNVRMSPSGKTTSIGTFRWDFGLESPVRYSLQIWGIDDGLADDPRVDDETWNQDQWTPDPDQLELIPEDFRWRVEAFDVNGQPLDSAEEKVDRPPSR